jgi:putative ATPase
MIFWGPAGSGKTTLAHLVASTTAAGVRALQRGHRGCAADPGDRRRARARLDSGGAQTILFVDEIHRLNKAQQDSLLPPSEDGTITLIGATTENPSFEINGALLSRTRVFVLQPLSADAITTLVQRALVTRSGDWASSASRWIPTRSNRSRSRRMATRRRALTVLEAAAAHVGAGGG